MTRLVADRTLPTPALIIDESHLHRRALHVGEVCAECGVELAYAVKACSLGAVIAQLASTVDGFAVTSVYEARLVRKIVSTAALSAAAPGWRDDEIRELAQMNICLYANSLRQLARIRTIGTVSDVVGIRVNPELSFVEDERYDPCRADSRLGIPLAELIKAWPGLAIEKVALHFHTNCDSEIFDPVLETVLHLMERAPQILKHCDSVNLGGGYTFPDDADLEPLKEVVTLLRDAGVERVVVEPGAGLIRSAVEIHAMVTDIMSRGDVEVAVLDTSVHQMPEVFEYQFEPDLQEHDDDGAHWYTLAGASCLAGDVFGEYGFTQPLAEGDRLTFTDAGAYTYVKASPFNGLPLPTVFLREADGSHRQIAQYSFQQYSTRNGVFT